MRTIHRKLIVAALAGGLAISLGPIRGLAQTPDESEQPSPKDTKQTKETKPSSPKSKDKGATGSRAEQRPAVLIGVVTVTPIVVTDTLLPKGAKYDPQVENADQMRASLASITGAVFNSDGELNDVIDHLVDADRDRLDKEPLMETDFERGQLSQLKGRVAEIKKVWKDKYGEEFEIKENQVYGPLSFAEGEITNARQFMQSWPVGATGKAPGKQKTGASARTGSDDKGAVTEKTRDQANLEDGRDFGVARFPAQEGLPAANVSFIDEAFGWKIDVPDGITTAQLRKNLLRELTYLGEHVDQWPANVKDAYRVASHHVAMALYGASIPRT